MNTPALTVIMPAYNESEAIVAAIQEVQRDVLDKIPGSELLVVNDGSKDDTGALADDLAAQDERVSVLHKANGGHGPALISGMAEAQGERFLLVDSDMQMPLDHAPALWAAMESGATAAFGVRRHRDDPQLRLWLTALIRSVLPLMFGVRIRDANVPYKMFSRTAWERIRPWIPDDTLAPSLFLALYIKSQARELKEIDVPHRERQTGEVSIKRWKLFKFCAKAFMQMVAFRGSKSKWPRL